MKDLLCPYMKNGVCYHSKCIYRPNYECNKPHTNKLTKKSKTRVKTDKNKYYPIKKFRKLMNKMFIIVKGE